MADEIPEIKEIEYRIAQNSNDGTIQLLKKPKGGDEKTIFAAYCPFVPAYVVDNKITRFGCNTLCPHARVEERKIDESNLPEDQKLGKIYKYIITCSGKEVVMEAKNAATKESANKPSKLVHL